MTESASNEGGYREAQKRLFDRIFAWIVRQSLLVRAVVLGLPSLLVIAGFGAYSARSLVCFVSVSAVVFLSGLLHAETETKVTVGVYFSTGRARQWRGTSPNLDIEQARIAAERVTAHWALFARTLITGTLIASTLLMPVWWIFRALGALLIWVVIQRVLSRWPVFERAESQRRRDSVASHALMTVRAGGPVDNYFLYLRPFVVTGRVRGYNEESLNLAKTGMHRTQYEGDIAGSSRTEIPVRVMRLTVSGDETAEVNPDLEELLQRGIKPYGALIALGRPGEAIGSGRVSSDEEHWQEAVMQLGARARGYIVMPSANSGTLWELGWLKEAKGFRGCLFLMPGKSPGFSGSEFWARASSGLAQTLKLPRFRGPPSMFCYDNEGIIHLAFLADRASQGSNGLVFHATGGMVRGAVKTLYPISRSDDPSATAKRAVEYAGNVASDLWTGGLCAWVDAHPARAKADRVDGAIVPLCGTAETIVHLGDKEFVVEFRSQAPMGAIILAIKIRTVGGGLLCTECQVQLLDADPTVLQLGVRALEPPSILRKSLLRIATGGK